MNCDRARDLLALSAGGDLAESEIAGLNVHLKECADCEQFQERLQSNQTLLRSLRREAVAATDLAEMRAGLFTQLENAPAVLGWRLRFERFLFSQMRRPLYAVAAMAVVVIVSATLFAQIRRVAANPDTAVAMFDGTDALLRPAAYREWIFIGSSTSKDGERDLFQNIYMSPTAYREYVRTGRFPEGTVMVREGAASEAKRIGTLDGAYEKEFVSLQVSVKDSSRFDGGWGFYEFTGGEGQFAAKASVQEENSRCVSCHRDRAAEDHVFTQFYPVLRSMSGVL